MTKVILKDFKMLQFASVFVCLVSCTEHVNREIRVTEASFSKKLKLQYTGRVFCS